MAYTDFYSRLDRLKKRRKGTEISYDFYDSINEGVTTSYTEFTNLRNKTEAWEYKSEKPSIRYALGAMQEVDQRYTEISIDTAKRIEQQLQPRLLNTYGIRTECRLQGSVPLNIHIKGVSDVDLLVLNSSHYRSEGFLSVLQKEDISVLQTLRSTCFTELRKAYPAVKLDTSGAKCLTLTGGSLPREVDIVPSHWVDTDEYKRTGEKYTRGVNILDNKVPTTLMNLPFTHIHAIESRCKYLTDGGLRKSIRLCKTLKADLIAEGTQIHLSSFDLASIMYHANHENLLKGKYSALAIVLETQRYFRHLINDQFHRNWIMTPDRTRKIFNIPEKEKSLHIMANALDQLVTEIRLELGFAYDFSIGTTSYTI